MMENTSTRQQSQMGITGRIILGTYLLILSALLVYLLFAFWPSAQPGTSGEVTVKVFGRDLKLSSDLQLIVLVGIVAALGSNIHAATSFADFAGNQRLYRNWVWWYVLRLSIGVSLALIFYFTIRGGFLSAGSTSRDINIFGVIAVAGLVGMFSKQATDKLRELFDTLFKTGKADDRLDKLANPLPQIARIDPDKIAAGTSGLSLSIHGNGFMKQSIVKLGSNDLATTFVSDTRLIVTIPDALTTKKGQVEVSVFNPPPAGGSSNVIMLEVT